VTDDLLLGLLAALGAAGCFDGAVILQAADARRVPAAHGLRVSLLRRLARRPRWVLGTAIAVLGWPLQLLAFSFAPVTVVQPALAVGTLLLLAAGARVLGEHVGRREWAGAAAVIAGVALLAVGHPDRSSSLPGGWTIAACLLVLAALAASPLARRPPPGLPWLVLAAGSAFALSAIAGKWVVSALDSGRVAAAVGFAAATAGAAGLGLLIDMTALQRFDATRVAPPMFVLETAIPVLLAPVLFAERWLDTPGGGSLVAAGLALVLGGGSVLGASRPVSAVDPGRVRAGDLQDELGGGRPEPVRAVGDPGSGERTADRRQQR
jgi:drug/metabolite transporter (DMT)-like permease